MLESRARGAKCQRPRSRSPNNPGTGYITPRGPRSPGTGDKDPGSTGPGPEVQDAESPGPGTCSQVRGAHGRKRGAKSPVRRTQKRAMRTGMMIVGVMNMMMIVLLLVLYLRSVGSMFDHMMFRWAF